MQEIYYPSNDGKTTIHACIWQAEQPKAVLQIVHGMAEYAERYAPLAVYLRAQGITVCLEDHLGHGKSVTDGNNLGYFADRKGYDAVLADIRALTEIMKKKNEGVPYFIMGHSMGSFFCRKYISMYGNELDGAIIMGTGFQPRIVTSSAKLVCRTVALFKGWRHRSKFINDLAFGSYNKRFGGRTEFDWLSVNPDNVDAYIADPLCGVPFTCNAFFGLFSIVGAACRNKTIKAVPRKLPLLLVAGGDDPVGSYGKGVEKLYKKLIKYGKTADIMLYNGCRHEIANDICAPQVFEDIARFLSENID